jgi:hypothetical protein
MRRRGTENDIDGYRRKSIRQGAHRCAGKIGGVDLTRHHQDPADGPVSRSRE